jgi:hypothetical protein
MQIASLSESANQAASLEQQIPLIKNIADREEAYEAIFRAITRLRWKGRFDLIPGLLAQTADGFQSDPSLAFQIATEQAASATDQTDYKAAAKAYLKAEDLANLPNINMQPRIYYCGGAGIFAELGDIDRARIWIDYCYKQELFKGLSCTKHFGLAADVALMHLSKADKLRFQGHLQSLKTELAQTPVETNCFIAGVAAAIKLYEIKENDLADSLSKALSVAFPDEKMRNSRASWVYLEQLGCGRNLLCVKEKLARILTLNDPAVKAMSLQRTLWQSCDAETKAWATKFLQDGHGQTQLRCALESCGKNANDCDLGQP